MKQTYRTALLLLLRECLKNCIIYWLVFCLVDYVHHGHYSWSHNLILALIFSPIVPVLRRLFLERNGGIRRTMR